MTQVTVSLVLLDLLAQEESSQTPHALLDHIVTTVEIKFHAMQDITVLQGVETKSPVSQVNTNQPRHRTTVRLVRLASTVKI